MPNGLHLDYKVKLKKHRFFFFRFFLFLDFDDYLLKDGIMGNLEIFVKDIESCKWCCGCSCKKWSQSHSQHVTHSLSYFLSSFQKWCQALCHCSLVFLHVLYDDVFYFNGETLIINRNLKSLLLYSYSIVNIWSERDLYIYSSFIDFFILFII